MKLQDVKLFKLPAAIVLAKKMIGDAIAEPGDVNVAPFAAILAFPTRLTQGAVVF
jgi:hypothetical protein